MALSTTALGYIYVAGAILFFGSFGLLVKIPPVARANVDAMVFQCYYSLAVFLTSWFVLFFVDFSFTWLGTAGASMWVPSSVLAISAIKLMGMATAQGVWSGTTIVISFMWGAFVFSEAIKDWYLTSLGLGLLLIGIFGISVCNLQMEVNAPPSMKFIYFLPWFKRPGEVFIPTRPKLEDEDYQDLSLNSEKFSQDPPSVTAEKAKSNTFLLGLICALVLGVINGSLLVPTQYVPEDCQGLSYVISFAIGVAIVTIGFAPIYFAVKFIFTRQLPQFHLKVAFLPGFVAGVIWNVGNVCSIQATNYLGLTIGYPLTQCALLVSGLWGMLLFKEITRIPAIILFIASAFILLGGAALLSLFG